MCFYFDWFSFYYTPVPPFTPVLGRKLDCRRKRKVKKLRMTNISRHTNLIKKEHLEMNNKEESSVVLGELSEFNKKGKQFRESVWIHRSAMISMAFIISWCHAAALLHDVCALSVSMKSFFLPDRIALSELLQWMWKQEEDKHKNFCKWVERWKRERYVQGLAALPRIHNSIFISLPEPLTLCASLSLRITSSVFRDRLLLDFEDVREMLRDLMR